MRSLVAVFFFIGLCIKCDEEAFKEQFTKNLKVINVNGKSWRFDIPVREYFSENFTYCDSCVNDFCIDREKIEDTETFLNKNIRLVQELGNEVMDVTKIDVNVSFHYAQPPYIVVPYTINKVYYVVVRPLESWGRFLFQTAQLSPEDGNHIVILKGWRVDCLRNYTIPGSQ